MQWCLSSPLNCIHVIEPPARFVAGGGAAKKWAAFDLRLGDRPCDRPNKWPWLTVSFAAVPSTVTHSSDDLAFASLFICRKALS